jgi:hypothetical protein
VGERESNKPQNVKTGMGVREREKENVTICRVSITKATEKSVCVLWREEKSLNTEILLERECVCVLG